jgi:hypothetical protein
MRWRIGLVIATMAIALAGQSLAIILMAPHDVRSPPRPGERAQSLRQTPIHPDGQQGRRPDGADVHSGNENVKQAGPSLIAGARFASRYHRRIVERGRLPDW